MRAPTRALLGVALAAVLAVAATSLTTALQTRTAPPAATTPAVARPSRSTRD
ncbi:MAG TPA: hypothetical protein VMN81_06715 [Vicinamibacterales bacterium]|nr:hypothetical protein [Vicinamibacterales bacterium]